MNKKGKYSPEFKEQAVKRTLSGSFTIKEVAGHLESAILCYDNGGENT
ncbi:transposase domain protein [Leptospira interrogans serovar Zanoni str. LT2156]|uniref:Transposase domain protein n=1 Tax=Leptospira interrogans serovar Zanoni str. LT2156 TaxID=1001601 RepID=M6HJ88_LEPIR|nr:transposase domain protein [Leptospira interrogans serovar Zanoni str. LT2156]